MATYIGLGSRVSNGISDGTRNGLWTIAFHPDDLHIHAPYFEVYHIAISGPPNSTFDLYVDSFVWDTEIPGEANSWDPNEAMILDPGNTLYFYYSKGPALFQPSPPTAIVWLRYDASIPANQQHGFYGA